MQQAPDCEMVLAHDDDLATIDGLGHDTVSRLLNCGHIFSLNVHLAVTGDSRT